MQVEYAVEEVGTIPTFVRKILDDQGNVVDTALEQPSTVFRLAGEGLADDLLKAVTKRLVDAAPSFKLDKSDPEAILQVAQDLSQVAQQLAQFVQEWRSYQTQRQTDAPQA